MLYHFVCTKYEKIHVELFSLNELVASLENEGNSSDFKQITKDKMSYLAIAKMIVKDEGWQGLFGRGLQVCHPL